MNTVIVYRNPAEEMFWNLLRSGDLIPLISGVLVFFIVFLGAMKIFGKKAGFLKTWQVNILLVFAASLGYATTHYMFQ
jgi:type IV secretory pathway VirB2 component (pilin)